MAVCRVAACNMVDYNARSHGGICEPRKYIRRRFSESARLVGAERLRRARASYNFMGAVAEIAVWVSPVRLPLQSSKLAACC